MAKKRILVASTPDGQYLCQRALSADYDLKFASTVHEAEHLLTEAGHTGFDLIICGIHFDDSRMFNLLQFVRKIDHFDNLPFLVIQAQDTALPAMVSIETTAATLGACGFLELHKLPASKANKVLQEAVKRSFDQPVKFKRLDSGQPKEG